MPGRAPTPYTCPSCGYQTNQKTGMRKHLYVKKLHCPNTENIIELTDEIKEHILKHRVYKIPVTQAPTIINNNQNIFNYNNVNNFINNMDPKEKLQHLHTHKQIEPIDLDMKIFQTFGKKYIEYKNDATEEYLGTDDLMDIVDRVCESSDEACSDFAIMYDTILNKINIRTDGEWESMLRDKGVKKVMHAIQKEYLDKYECFLIRKITSFKDRIPKEAQSITEKLKDYYSFIGCFDLYPFVKDANDHNVLNNEKYNSFVIKEHYMKEYDKLVKDLTKSQINKAKQDVQDILKRNTKRNIDDLNTKVMDLLRIDQDFKDTIVQKLKIQASI